MKTNSQPKTTFLKNNDQITFRYQIYFYNEQKQLKSAQNNDEELTITLGQNQWLNNIDQFLINKPLNQAGCLIIDHFVVDQQNHPLDGKTVYLEIYLKSYQKPKHDLIVIENVEDLKTKTNMLVTKIEQLESQIKTNLAAFQLKQSELQNKFTSEIDKIKADLKIQNEAALAQEKQFLQTKLLSELIDPLATFKQIIDYCQDQSQFASFIKSFAMLEEQLWTILDRYGLKVIDVAIGQDFDPTYHQLNQFIIDPDQNEQTIAKVVVNGYRLYDRVLKPAQVDVYKK